MRRMRGPEQGFAHSPSYEWSVQGIFVYPSAILIQWWLGGAQ